MLRPLALIAALVLAGCIAGPAPSGVGDEQDRNEPEKEILLNSQRYVATLEAPWQILVQVPAGATDVHVEIMNVAEFGFSGANIELSGCGDVHLWEDEAPSAPGFVWASTLICIGPRSGEQLLSVQADLLPLSGTLSLYAHVLRN